MIEVTIYNIITVAIGSVFLASFYEPIQPLKNRLLAKLPDNTIGRSLISALSCPKCVSFNVSLIVFIDLQAALLTCMVGYFLSHFIDRVKVWYE
tara:strand:+ start:69 stop:350 length:282 start_codon:yes stop_codon:yes gene_type:complete